VHRRGAILVPGATRVVIFGWVCRTGGGRSCAASGARRDTRAARRDARAAVAAETSACDAPYASHARRLHARAPARDSL